MEKRVEVKTYMVYKICPECEDGKMLYEDGIGSILLTYPAQFLHRCDKCGYELTYLDRYPKIEYEEIKQGD